MCSKTTVFKFQYYLTSNQTTVLSITGVYFCNVYVLNI
jgi:hypothetical protein